MRKIPLGFEVELEDSRIDPREGCFGVVQRVKTAMGEESGTFHVDYSLDRGFEFSSHPTVSDDFLFSGSEKWRKFFRSLMKACPGAQPMDSCGMHIHIGKSALTPSDIIRLNYFVFNNVSFCEYIGDRSNRYFYSYSDPNVGKQIKLNLDKKSGFRNNSDYSDDYKYRALNVARIVTIEFRFFRSVNKFKLLMKNIQFVIALVEFVKSGIFSTNDFKEAKDSPTKLSKVSARFIQFVYENSKKYRYLFAYLCDKPMKQV